MKTKYIDLINQTFDFPQEEFRIENNKLFFHDIPLSNLIEKFGTPFKFIYLPKIDENIRKSQLWFQNAFKKLDYQGKYYYCYCTKSSHFSHVIQRTLDCNAHLETSSAYDMDIVEALVSDGKLTKEHYILCNGFKRDLYIQNIAKFINKGFSKIIPIIDNYEEVSLLNKAINTNYQIGIRIASEEEPKFEFYTSRLGIGYKNIVPFYHKEIKNNRKISLKILHFFINTGIRDTAYYWNELHKCLKVYIDLKKVCPTLNGLNIGGGFPIKDSLAFKFDYQHMIDEIINQIKITCEEAEVTVPNIFTEFGSFTIGESGGAIYKILHQKQQNDREKWNMIDSSFITTLPDTWALNHRFIMLPITNWDKKYERVLLGGLTCDSDDYYNSEQHINAIYLPTFTQNEPLYIGFFNTGAYQESIGGFGGLQHCLIPQPKHLLIDKDNVGNISVEVFSEQQSAQDVLKILGYKNRLLSSSKETINFSQI